MDLFVLISCGSSGTSLKAGQALISSVDDLAKVIRQKLSTDVNGALTVVTIRLNEGLIARDIAGNTSY
ncbi:hypothetical protein bcCo53_001525 (plasmid) [Borrelia coriaceae]|uniref:Uncharacterized protein n=1 Tax=Borrelia coriaceae ATCC 43381 TaxID=1408429 RepID=W5SXR8_9SPIR|nr:hypothetical protein [Borrelia coriaceae]AHH11705.1 hypothetical protein BCO_0900129 [Borrelia coriaceae ATCC 43381]UPA17339.1 hypothetical protein bcCo53_001525 [Borrelia coriaceae]